MSVQQYLSLVASKAILASHEKISIGVSILTLEKRLMSYFGSEISTKMQFGSSTRNTILPRAIDENSDIDYMVVFSDTKYQPQTYLDKLRRFMSLKYSTSDVAQSNPTIRLRLNHIIFEIVPAIEQILSGLQIPAKASNYNDWIQTDPNDFNFKLTESNAFHNNHIKPMVRVVKYWNAKNGYVFDSYLLEKHLVDTAIYRTCFKEYVYAVFQNLNLPYGAAQSKKNKLNRAKQLVQNTIDFERRDMPIRAEAEIKKLVPAFWL